MWQSMHQIGRFFLGTQMRQDVFGIRSKENSCVYGELSGKLRGTCETFDPDLECSPSPIF